MRQIIAEYPKAFADEQFEAAKNAYEALGETFKVPVTKSKSFALLLPQIATTK
ncbi:MAG: hypothetical protein AABM67_02545 [Acidobacteriota bacterium]